MDHYQFIAERFQNTIEAITLSVDELAEPLAEAADRMVKSLLDDRKIVCCGNGVDAALAQLFTCYLLDRLHVDRPALPAMALGAELAGLTAIAGSNGLDDIFSRQLQALGQPGDLLLCINTAKGEAGLLRAVEAARERNMTVVALTNNRDEALADVLSRHDIILRINAPDRARCLEVQTMAVHCLCELIDNQLFGAYEENDA